MEEGEGENFNPHFYPEHFSETSLHNIRSTLNKKYTIII